MVTYTHNPSTQRLMQEDLEFQASLGYIARTYLKKKKKQTDMVVRIL
jgi:hypothetical protein